jgi:hypothetical protein
MNLSDIGKIGPILVVQDSLAASEYQVGCVCKLFPEFSTTLREMFHSNWGFYPGEGGPDVGI